MNIPLSEITDLEGVAAILKHRKQLSKTPVIISIADVQREEVDWLWMDRIPKKKLTIIEGDPGTGKSWLTMNIACAVTLGAALPGQGTRDPANVLLLTAEDGLADTIRPRLEDMGANLSRVNALEGIKNKDGKEECFSLADDIEALEEALKNGEYALVIIDPINAYLGGNIDTYKDSALRSVLTPLAKLAERFNVAIVCVRHLSKGSGIKAIYRGVGSIGYTAAARVVHLVGINPNNEDERAIICVKNNLAPKPPALSFELADKQFHWLGETTLTAEQLLGDPTPQKLTAIDEAKEYLLDRLKDGPLRATEVENGAELLGISERTLKRAKSAIGVESNKEGFGNEGYWVLSLPNTSQEVKNAKEISEKNLAFLGTEDHAHEYEQVTNAHSTYTCCKYCGAFPPGGLE